ncbi:MAG: hypothetical protein KDN19_02110 [Verrucomicrobiae bacterium]|nr:hypothetical protein [Verrucomicrobiae bacterium]
MVAIIKGTHRPANGGFPARWIAGVGGKNMERVFFGNKLSRRAKVILSVGHFRHFSHGIRNDGFAGICRTG